MPDHAVSSDPAVQTQLARLWSLSPGADVLGLSRISALLARLGDPHRRLPPVFHVAGTNGKGSTCAFLRAMLEADGLRVHVYSSPHLCRFNERIRLAGQLIDDGDLASLLAEVLDLGGDIGASFFEVTTAAAFLAFSRVPADACVIEVGLGGRLDATNVVHPLVCGIAGLGIDHEGFLLAEEAGTPTEPIARIAFEKAGIAKAGVPLVTLDYTETATDAVRAVAVAKRAPWMQAGASWSFYTEDDSLIYTDAAGKLRLPLPALKGAHQISNAALAVGMLRHQPAMSVSPAALARGVTGAVWPARMQQLAWGPLTCLAGEECPDGIWLDGAHNESAAGAIARDWPRDKATAIIIGMLANKDASGVLRHLVMMAESVRVIAVPVAGHAHHAPADLAALAKAQGAAFTDTAASIEEAFRALRGISVDRILVAGSLYLAGEVLTLNDEKPT